MPTSNINIYIYIKRFKKLTDLQHSHKCLYLSLILCFCFLMYAGHTT